MIPQSASAKDIGMNPTILAIKGALDQFDTLRQERSKIFEEGVQRCQNYNAIEDLLQVHTGQAEKGSVFEKNLQAFRSIYAPIEGLEK